MRGENRKRLIVSAFFGALPFGAYWAAVTFGFAAVAMILLGVVLALACYTCPIWYD